MADISQTIANMWWLTTAILIIHILLISFRKGMCMGEKDKAENYLEAYNDVFADIVNVLLFDGKRVVNPNQLRQGRERAVYKADGELHEGKISGRMNMHNNKPSITKENVTSVFDSRFIKVFGLEYVAGKQYMNATRREMENLVALKNETEFQTMLPDAVSCIVILDGEDPKLLLTYEFRYPAGQYLLSVPAGLIDKKDENEADPILATAIRELREETNIGITEADRVEIVNPLLFSTPGMTDESNALVSIVIADETRLRLSQDGAEGTECFDGFVTLTRKDAKRILKQGKDDNGIFYSVYTWAALMYFVSDLWR